MGEIKTKKTTASVSAHIKAIENLEQRKDAQTLLSVFKDATGLKPALWGTAIIGFGSYHYKSERSTQEGDWPLTAFSLRKQNITIYIMPGFKEYTPLLKKIGTHKVSGGSCLYIKRLSDIHIPTLTTLIKRSVVEMKKRYKV